VALTVVMPKLGFNMDTGTLTKWYKKENDPIVKGEPFFAVETDKTTIDVEATESGIVRKIFVQEGDEAPVTTPIAIVAGKDEDIGTVQPDVAADTSPSAPAVPSDAVSCPAAVPDLSEKSARPAKCSPRARRIANELGIPLEELAGLTGSGVSGGITAKDVELYAASRTEAKVVRATPLAARAAKAEGIALDTITGSGVNGKILMRDVETAIPAPAAAVSETVTAAQPHGNGHTDDGIEIAEVKKYSGVRKVIGERMAQSKKEVPHIYFTSAVDMSALLALRKKLNSVQEKKLSVSDFLVKAVSITLQRLPQVNASLRDGQIYTFKSTNIGLAVAAKNGLIVPVIRDAQELSLLQVSERSSQLVAKAREGKLMPNEYSGGTFTISNMGMYGIDQFDAVVNPPEAAILAVSATIDKPVVIKRENGEKAIEIRPMMNVTLSADHRVVDGVDAGLFVKTLKEILEEPIQILM